MRPLCNAVSCSVGQMQVSQPIFLISFGRIKRHHAGLAGWGLSLERKGAAGSCIDGIYGIAPNVGCPTRKNLKDKVYPSKTKTNCPNKTKPAFVTALTGRKGSGVEAVTQLLFQCRSACADFAFPSCKAELKKPLTRKLKANLSSCPVCTVSTVAVNRPKSPGINPTGLCVLILYSASMLAFLLCLDSL